MGLAGAYLRNDFGLQVMLDKTLAVFSDDRVSVEGKRFVETLLRSTGEDTVTVNQKCVCRCCDPGTGSCETHDHSADGNLHRYSPCAADPHEATAATWDEVCTRVSNLSQVSDPLSHVNMVCAGHGSTPASPRRPAP